MPELKLSEWADKNGKTYMQAYRSYKNGKIDGSFTDNKGSIFVKFQEAINAPAGPDSFKPVLTASRSRAGSETAVDINSEFLHIQNGVMPQSSVYGQTGSRLSINEVIELCQKAYHNIGGIKNMTNLMVEFSVNPNIYLKGGNKQSRAFFQEWFKIINLFALQTYFFMEYYRSGNVFIYKMLCKIRDKSLASLEKKYEIKAARNTIPLRYTILNPVDVCPEGNINFSNAIYSKKINGYELERLRNPRTKEDAAVLDGLPEEVRKQIKSKASLVVLMPLDERLLTAIFLNKQPYESMAMPLFWPVLTDVNWKEEMKRIDMSINRTVHQVILLVTTGSEPDKGGVNPLNVAALTEIFSKATCGLSVVADHTTKAEFIIPDISKVLNPEKYKIINEDIQQGLNNILTGTDEKFANQHIKVKMFVERLSQSRETFLRDFLIPEMEAVAEDLGFKNCPIPYYEDLAMENEIEYSKIYTRLVELGVLTPSEGVIAINSGKLPTEEESLESQKKFKAFRDEGLYEAPLNKKIAEEKGRPGGSPSPKTSSPIGAEYSMTKLIENTKLANNAQAKINEALKKKFKLKKLNAEQEEVGNSLLETIICDENPENWESSIPAYIETMESKNTDRSKQVKTLMARYDLKPFAAAILLSSPK